MIRVMGHEGDLPIGMFLLEDENLTRLQAGDPIVVELHNPRVRIVIGYANPDDQAVKAILAKATADGATIHVLPRGPEEPQ